MLHNLACACVCIHTVDTWPSFLPMLEPGYKATIFAGGINHSFSFRFPASIWVCDLYEGLIIFLKNTAVGRVTRIYVQSEKPCIRDLSEKLECKQLLGVPLANIMVGVSTKLVTVYACTNKITFSLKCNYA